MAKKGVSKPRSVQNARRKESIQRRLSTYSKTMKQAKKHGRMSDTITKGVSLSSMAEDTAIKKARILLETHPVTRKEKLGALKNEMAHKKKRGDFPKSK